MGLFFLDLVLFGWILRLSNERGQTEFHCFFFICFKKVERGNKGWVVSVCELQFALHRACETDTSLGVGMEPKIADERRKREELRKNGRDLPFLFICLEECTFCWFLLC